MVPATDVDTSASTSPDDSEQPTISAAITAEIRIEYERTGMCISVNLADRGFGKPTVNVSNNHNTIKMS